MEGMAIRGQREMRRCLGRLIAKAKPRQCRRSRGFLTWVGRRGVGLRRRRLPRGVVILARRRRVPVTVTVHGRTSRSRSWERVLRI